MTCVNGYGKGFARGIYNSPKDFSISASFGSWRAHHSFHETLFGYCFLDRIYPGTVVPPYGAGRI